MRYPVIVESKSENEFAAELLGKPELRAVAPTEAEALAKVERSLEEWLRPRRLVQVTIPARSSDNAWRVRPSSDRRSSCAIYRGDADAEDKASHGRRGVMRRMTHVAIPGHVRHYRQSV